MPVEVQAPGEAGVRDRGCRGRLVFRICTSDPQVLGQAAEQGLVEDPGHLPGAFAGRVEVVARDQPRRRAVPAAAVVRPDPPQPVAALGSVAPVDQPGNGDGGGPARIRRRLKAEVGHSPVPAQPSSPEVGRPGAGSAPSVFTVPRPGDVFAPSIGPKGRPEATMKKNKSPSEHSVALFFRRNRRPDVRPSFSTSQKPRPDLRLSFSTSQKP